MGRRTPTVHLFNRDGNGGVVTRCDDAQVARGLIVREHLIDVEGIDVDDAAAYLALSADERDGVRRIVADTSARFARHRARFDSGRIVGVFEGGQYEGWQWNPTRAVGRRGVTRAVWWVW